MFHNVIPIADRKPIITRQNVGSVVTLIVSPNTMKQRIIIDLRLWSDMVISFLIIFIHLSSAYPCG